MLHQAVPEYDVDTVTFGDIRVDAISDGELRIPFERLFGHLEKGRFATNGGVSADYITATLTTFVIRTPERTVLVDTGQGPSLKSPVRFGPGTHWGQLPQAMQSGAIRPESVDVVVMTHLHADHIGWNTIGAEGESRPMFPRARYLVAAREWAYWSALNDPAVEQHVRSLLTWDHLDLVDDEHEIIPGVRLFLTPGHTPGHMSVLVLHEGKGGVITGDAAHHPTELESPEFGPTVDIDPVLARRSREALVERIEQDGLVVFGTHFPQPNAGALIRVEQKRVWRWQGA